jgi:CheY-like chemotaxis protein
MLAHIRHIIIVDDEDDCHFVARLVLRKAGYTGQLTAFTDAEDALRHMRAGHDAPDLLFVDINMPGMGGFDMIATCEQEGLLPNGTSTVVMLSSSNRPMDMQTARNFRSVDSYIEKSLTVEALERVAQEHQRRQRA